MGRARYRQIVAFCLILIGFAALGSIGYMGAAAIVGTQYPYQYCTGPQYQYCSTSTSTTISTSTTSATTTTTGTTTTTTSTTTTATTTTTTTTTTKHHHKPPKCRVPKVVGKTFSKAKRAIRSHHCRVGKVRHRWSRKFAKDKVIAQRPPGGRMVAPNHRVNLVVSIGLCHNDHDHDLDDRCPPVTEHNKP
jgi:hypothetical protein